MDIFCVNELKISSVCVCVCVCQHSRVYVYLAEILLVLCYCMVHGYYLLYLSDIMTSYNRVLGRMDMLTWSKNVALWLFYITCIIMCMCVCVYVWLSHSQWLSSFWMFYLSEKAIISFTLYIYVYWNRDDKMFLTLYYIRYHPFYNALVNHGQNSVSIL